MDAAGAAAAICRKARPPSPRETAGPPQRTRIPRLELVMPDMAGEAIIEEVEHPQTFSVDPRAAAEFGRGAASDRCLGTRPRAARPGLRRDEDPELPQGNRTPRRGGADVAAAGRTGLHQGGPGGRLPRRSGGVRPDACRWEPGSTAGRNFATMRSSPPASSAAARGWKSVARAAAGFRCGSNRTGSSSPSNGSWRSCTLRGDDEHGEGVGRRPTSDIHFGEDRPLGRLPDRGGQPRHCRIRPPRTGGLGAVARFAPGFGPRRREREFLPAPQRFVLRFPHDAGGLGI